MLLSYLFLRYKEFDFYQECSYNGACIELQYKECEFHQEWSKASDENWSQIPMSFKNGQITAFIFTKKLFFLGQKSLNNALQMSV